MKASIRKLHDEFAKAAMQSIVARDGTATIFPKDCAERAYKMADAMLAARATHVCQHEWVSDAEDLHEKCCICGVLVGEGGAP